jgi:hypothetical protein
MSPIATPLFITGTARSGTNLIARLAGVHPRIEVAIDPYLPLLRSFRNAAIRAHCDASVAAAYTAAPFQDYYFTDERLQVMDAVQAAELDVPFDAAERPALVEATRARAALEAPDLVPSLERLGGATYRELFDRAFSIVAEARNAPAEGWVGIKEVWTIEFCAALSRAYPGARFIVIMRDPRAVIASMHKLAEKDASQRAHTLSYLRHWRKCAAFCIHYGSDPQLRGRLHVVRYENLVADRSRSAREVCDFLEVDWEPRMMDEGGLWDPATQSVWRGNSSYGSLRGIDTAPVEKWRATLDPAAAALADLVCGPEMRLFGYEPSSHAPDSTALLEFLLRDDAECHSWRSDLQDIQQDFGFELFRAALAGAQHIMDQRALRRSFLFPSVSKAVAGAPAWRTGTSMNQHHPEMQR